MDLVCQPANENAEESYENIVESILSLAGGDYRRLWVSVHYDLLGRGLAAISWAGQKLNVSGKRTPALLA